MAQKLGISEKDYQKYVNCEVDFSVGILIKIAEILNIELSVLLTGEEPRLGIFAVTRAGKGAEVNRREQYSYESLGDNFNRKKVEPFLVEVMVDETGDIVTNSHKGQEFNYVLAGCVKYVIHNNEIILNPGDSIYFDSNYEHGMRALGDQNAKFLAIIV
jgi:quercetin dioxygenase-like cupin family protein